MKYKLLCETTIETNYISELDEKDNSKKFFIEGITLSSNKKNKNGRIYPEQILDEAIQKYIEETKNLGMTMEGTLNHPKESCHEVDLKEVSHRFVKLEKDGTNWISKAQIADTPNGQIVKNLLENGTKLGLSSRGLGQVSQKKDATYVDNFKLITPADIVHRPSCSEALITHIYESKEYVYENGILIEKDLSEDIDNYQKLIKNSTKENRAKIFESIILDYFDKILK